ncbi:MAG TPA: penicillin-binding transpeptidase domain-containing protein [Candidatus Paceibacterota bacterium]|nr:penicillin-binding transpeptidase domain-containing protein [Candidatus Paceibacterota bacterium]
MRFFRKKRRAEISFDEILLDSSNLPSFNTGRLEGRIELPLQKRNVYVVGGIFAVIALVFFSQLVNLQVIQGAELNAKSESNRLDQSIIIAERGIIYDRYGELLAWNERDAAGKYDFPVRAYTDRRGFGQLLGYVSYPQRDKAGFYYRTEYIGRNGVESAYDDVLRGENGRHLIEENVHGDTISENAVDEPVPGKPLSLALDAELSEVMYDLIASTTAENGFRSGAAAMMDVDTGEIVALASFPSYDPEVLADGDDVAKIEEYNADKRFPFLDKVMGGAYVPGSIVKPIVAYGALAEHIISPDKVIVSTGSLTIPNPYDPSHPAVYRDWNPSLGAMTIREGLAFSSNVFLMTIGGGFGDQKGLGIAKLDKYYRLFGLGQRTGVPLDGEQAGVVPDPVWKEKVFKDEWRLGDTYLTSIGQFGFQVTPLQMLRAYAAIANGGKLVTPQVVLGAEGDTVDLHLDQSALTVVKEGMREAVTKVGGTARALDRKDVMVAAKSGTAELGTSKAYVNSWVAGFFPYEHPKYVFILLMEYGPRTNTVGSSSVMGKVFEWMATHRKEYFGA